jgi:NCS1 nucleoside transporter family
MSVAAPVAPVSDPTRHYGQKVTAVEPGGVEPIPLDERHGSPISLLWIWVSPNMEFATIAVGILGVLAFGLTFWQAVGAIVVGTALGSISQGVLSTWGPREGLCQMVLSRTGFGFLGNFLPAGLNAVTAGIGWFAVNSISGALALHALFTSMPKELCLIIVVAVQLVVAFFGHNLVHAFEKYVFPVLTVIFVVASIIVLSKAHPGEAAFSGEAPTLGGFLITAGAAFGYAAGWNPYASDYTRYMPAESKKSLIAIYAGLGVFLSCVLLEVAGAAMVSAAGKAADVDPGVFTGLLPTWIGKLTLLAICLGAIAANVLNVYSGAMSFMSIGLKLPLRQARALVAVVFGIIGFIVASFGLKNAGTDYENFLLIIAYWIAPWLGVVFVDRVLRRGQPLSTMTQSRSFQNWAGPIAMIVGAVISIWLFSNQTKYLAPIPKAHPNVGDLTAEVGFVLSAVLYYVLYRVLPKSVEDPAAVETASLTPTAG